MPLFGNRVVVGTANVKHIKEFKDGISQRESALAEWEIEREKRKEKLEVLQTQISQSRRNSDVSHTQISHRSRRNSDVSQKSTDPKDLGTEADSNNEDVVENDGENFEQNMSHSSSEEKNLASKQSSNPTCAGCVLF